MRKLKKAEKILMLFITFSLIFFGSYVLLPIEWIEVIGLPNIPLETITIILYPLAIISIFIIVRNNKKRELNEV